MDAGYSLSSQFGGLSLSLSSIPTLSQSETDPRADSTSDLSHAMPRSSSELVLSPRVEVDIPIVCVPLGDALREGTVKKVLELFEDKKIPQAVVKVSSQTFLLNNYATPLDELPEIKDGKITFTVDGEKRTILASEAHSEKKELFPEEKYAQFADHVFSKLHKSEECHSFSIADGCGLGEKPKAAAEHAARHSIEFLNIKSLTPKKVIAAQVDALQKVQKQLESDKEKFGRTTLTIVTIAKDVLAVTWIGDCKLFLLREHQCIDITGSSRSNSLTACDSGGALGNNGEIPDWGNVSSALVTLENTDRLILCTDGVYDNFDPEYQGKKPSEYGFAEEKWVPKNRVMRDTRAQELLKSFHALIAGKKLHQIGPALQKYITELTHKRKLFLYDHPHERAPEDCVEFPGKPDHATAVILEVQITKKGNGSRLGQRFSASSDK
ncbi:MAG: protein phosphatase 2C family protein [Verrucomicrobia bacterium]|nr:protein phosphatase 2C family protein [Verrucomicrobiota bacterium]